MLSGIYLLRLGHRLYLLYHKGDVKAEKQYVNNLYIIVNNSLYVI